MKTIYSISRNFFFLLLGLTIITLTSCGDDDENGSSIVAKFSIEKDTYYTNEAIQITNESTGGSLSYSWDFGNGTTSSDKDPVVTYTEAGIYIIKLTASDGGASASAQKSLQIEVEPEPDKGILELKWVGQHYLGDIRSVSPAIAPDGNVVMTSEDHTLRKFSKTDGSQIWEFDLWTSADGVSPEGNTLSSPSIDTDGTIYVGTGNTGNKIGRFYAITSSGTKKWVAADDKDNGFWNQGNNSLPRIQYLTAAIGDNSVFAGNAGSTGSIVAFDKTTGNRKGYVTEGTGGPAGGVSAGVLLYKNNNIIAYGGIYGLFSASAAQTEQGPTAMSWANYRNANERVEIAVSASMALGSDGTIYGLGHFAEATMGGPSAFAVTADGTEKWRTSLGAVGTLDQGGVAIGSDGTVYVTVKRTPGESNGGVVALDSSNGNVKWKFGIPEDVSNTVAIDQNGYIHMATDAGNYYIIDPENSDDRVIVKQDIASLIIESGSTFAEGWVAGQGKCWSSPVIDDDGTIYVGITNMEDRNKSLLVSLTHPDVKGLANSVWPMKAKNKYHTNRQP